MLTNQNVLITKIVLENLQNNSIILHSYLLFFLFLSYLSHPFLLALAAIKSLSMLNFSLVLNVCSNVLV